VVAPLVQQGFRAIAPDLRGYNLSDKPTDVDAYAIEHLVADLTGLIEVIGERKIVIVSHDWGGVVGYVYAHRNPGRVRGLVMLSAPHPDIWGHREIDPEQADAGDAYIPLLAGPLGEAAFLMFEGMLSPYLGEAELARYRQAWEQPGAQVAMNNWYRANLYPEVTLPTGMTIEVETLALWGMLDTFVTPSQLAHLPRYVKNLEVVTYAEGNHWLPLQLPEEIVKQVVRFERRLAR
jgi:pimeloyl-ACP methyl ester carboxylesterase